MKEAVDCYEIKVSCRLIEGKLKSLIHDVIEVVMYLPDKGSKNKRIFLQGKKFNSINCRHQFRPA